MQAIFAAGCFWGIENSFAKLPGIVKTEVGYCGGTKENPSYEEVCSGRTGHAEAIRLEYDPKIISYEELLEAFFKLHDPTTLNRQGPDIGEQYRSIIFYIDEDQKNKALQMKHSLNISGKFNNEIVTEILPAMPFYRAEEYHQQYIKKKKNPY